MMTMNSLTPLLYEVLCTARQELRVREKTEGSFSERFAESLIHQAADQLGVELSTFERDDVLSALLDDTNLFGMLQPLIDDVSVNDIIISGPGTIAIQRGRKNVLTDYLFSNQQEYERFVERLLLRSGTMYSTRAPVVDGMIGDLIRVHAVHSSIAAGGPYLTIRINRFSSISCEQLCNYELAPYPILDYLNATIRAGNTILIAGEVATGKTTLLRALAAELGLHESIVVIEDTPEIKIQHPLVRYLTTREENNEQQGALSSCLCIRAAMRMAMNRVVLGEIRDAEAAEAFVDAASSGHPGLSTIHARTASDALVRLKLFLTRAQPGVTKSSILEQITTAVQIVVQLAVCPVTGMRRIVSVVEIGTSHEGVLQVNEIFRYSGVDSPHWKLTSRVSRYLQDGGHEVDMLRQLPAMLTASSHLSRGIAYHDFQ